jgi:hypothetical protein
MKRVWLVLVMWVLSGVGAVLGSILGSGGGQRWLFVGAVVGGVIGTVSAAYVVSKLRLILPEQMSATALGGLIGFWVAAPIAASNLHTPVVPVLGTALTGLGALLGGRYFTGAGTDRLQMEASMNRNVQVAIVGFLLLLPALVLASCGFLGLEPPAALVHPVLVMGGLLLNFGLNALAVLRVRFGHNEGALVATISVRVRGSVLNLTAFVLCCLLFATITAYVFVENFQPR